MRARWMSLCALAIAASACEDRSALERQAAALPAQRLVGTWDVRFELERSPVLTMGASAAAPPVRGRVALLANRWLKASYPQIETPTNYGTYDIDFTPFGFEPRNTGTIPTAVAGWLATNKDSVEIILAADQDGTTVELLGGFEDDSIAGTWYVSIARVTGGGGRFVMRRARER